MTRLFVAVLSFALVGCNAGPPVAPPPPGPSTCASACENLRKHACLVGQPTKGGATCEQVCTTSRDNGVAWQLECLTSTSSCSACGQ